MEHEKRSNAIKYAIKYAIKSDKIDKVDGSRDAMNKKEVVNKNIEGSNVFSNIRSKKISLVFLVINKDDRRVASRAILFEENGKDIWKFLISKEKKLKLKTHQERGEFHRGTLYLYSRSVYDDEDKNHKKNVGASWYATSFENSFFIDERVFKEYQKTKGGWLEMSGEDFNTNSLKDIEGRNSWLGKIQENYNAFDIQFKSVMNCEKNGNVYGDLVIRKTAVTFMAIGDGSTVNHVIIHDENGMDLRQFLLSKEKTKFKGNRERGQFLREELLIQDMHVFDKENTYHVQNEGALWYVSSFEKSNFHDESLFDKYKQSKGGWYEMTEENFDSLNLMDPDGQKTWLSKIREKYDDWNIVFKVMII